MEKKFYCALSLFVLLAAVAVAQRFNPDTRYRIVAHGTEGVLVDEALAYDDDVIYSTLTYRLGTQTDSTAWWYIHRLGNGWTLRNAATDRYLEFRKYTYSYTWNNQVYTDEGQTVRTNPQQLGDSAVWMFDYEDGAFRLNSASSPQWLLGVYTWDYEYGSGSYVEPMLTSWVFDRYITSFDVYAEDGTLVTGEGTPGYVFSSLRLNGKTPVRLNAEGDCLVTMAAKYANSDYEATVTWNGQEDLAYRMDVVGAEQTAAGFRIAGVSCLDNYPFRIVDDEEQTIVSGTLHFTTLPIAELCAKGINGSTYVKGTFRLQDPDYAGEDTTYTAETKVRGATAQRYPKKPYNVKLREADGVTDCDANLLGLRNTHTWILDAMYVDRIRMRNRVCFDTWNEMDRLPYATNYDGRNGTVGRFVEVFVDGDYKGVYCLTDKVNRKLLNLTKVLVGLDSTDVTPRGLLYKGKQWGDDTYLKSVYSGNLPSSVIWGNWELEYPDENPSTAAWVPLRNLINFGKMSDARFTQDFDQNYYFGNLLNYVMLQLAYNLQDNGMKNMYISTKNIEKAGKRMIFTVWDMDSSLGGYWDGKHNNITADTTYVTRVHPLSRLFSRNLMGFRDSLRLKWHNLRETTLASERLAERLDAYATLLTESGAWAREYSLWGTSCGLTEDINDEIQYVKEWYARNINYLNELLPELPTAIVRLRTEPNASQGIYTLDGRRVEGRSWQDLPHGIYIINGRKVIR